MSQDPSRPRLSFAPRVRGELAVATHKVGVMAAMVSDVAFRTGSGRVTALRVDRPGVGDGVVSALFATPTRDGRVRVPPRNSRGWTANDPVALPGVRWLSALPGRPVLDCTGAPVGEVVAVVVRHLEQRVCALVLDDGRRAPVDEIAFLRDGSVVVEADSLISGEVPTWMALQEDHAECGLWWRDGALHTPPPLQAPTAAAAL